MTARGPRLGVALIDDMAGRESDVDISKSRDGRKTWGVGEGAGEAIFMRVSGTSVPIWHRL